MEERIALLEGGLGALAVASGQAAEFLALLNITNEGDNTVSATSLYGGTYNLLHHTLPKLGISTTFVDPSNPANFQAAIKPNTKAIYAETVGNPRLDTLDIEAVAKIAHANGLPLIIDNTLPSPYLVNPLKWGLIYLSTLLPNSLADMAPVLGGLSLMAASLIGVTANSRPLPSQMKVITISVF